MVTRFDVASEVGTLHRVLLHRPDLELRRLTPSNVADPLFADESVAVLYGGVDTDRGAATIEGGDVLVVGRGVKARRERLGQVDEPVDVPAELVEAR